LTQGAGFDVAHAGLPRGGPQDVGGGLGGGGG
jgi:hypothetical protein